jgi:hypothetical protein
MTALQKGERMCASTEFRSFQETNRRYKKTLIPVWLLVIVLTSIGLLTTERACAQAVAEVRSTGPIPQNHYKTWSLFLVCNQDWLAPEKSMDLYHLYQQFGLFGRAIGADHLAVWFWKSDKRASDPKLADDIDLDRSMRFCKEFGLKPSSGPFVFVTTRYPDEMKTLSNEPISPKDYAYFELAKMNPKDVSDLLLRLTDQLVIEGRIHDPSSEAEGGLWVRLLEVAQRAIGSFGCAWTFKVQTGLLTAELHACQSP